MKPFGTILTPPMFDSVEKCSYVVSIYNLRRKREVGVLLEHTDEITCLAFVGKGFLLSGGADNTICIWRTSDWLCLHKLGGHKAAVTSVAPHPSGKLALSTGKDRTLRLWDLVKGRIAFITRLEEVGEKVFWSPNAEQYVVKLLPPACVGC
jgi:protein MAK11